MGSFVPANSRKPPLLFCRIRKKWVADLPEERVRQHLIYKMHHHLGYPLPQILIEKSLKRALQFLPKKNSVPARRSDLIVFAPDIHSACTFSPLLLIECKATRLDSQALSQLMGYNHFLQAPFAALANEEECTLSWRDSQTGEVYSCSFLPCYSDLRDFAKMCKVGYIPK